MRAFWRGPPLRGARCRSVRRRGSARVLPVRAAFTPVAEVLLDVASHRRWSGAGNRLCTVRAASPELGVVGCARDRQLVERDNAHDLDVVAEVHEVPGDALL